MEIIEYTVNLNEDSEDFAKKQKISELSKDHDVGSMYLEIKSLLETLIAGDLFV